MNYRLLCLGSSSSGITPILPEVYVLSATTDKSDGGPIPDRGLLELLRILGGQCRSSRRGSLWSRADSPMGSSPMSSSPAAETLWLFLMAAESQLRLFGGVQISTAVQMALADPTIRVKKRFLVSPSASLLYASSPSQQWKRRITFGIAGLPNDQRLVILSIACKLLVDFGDSSESGMLLEDG